MSRRYGARRYGTRSMLRIRRPRIQSANYMGDTVTVRFRNETQVNLKQLVANGGIAVQVPGNWLPDVDIPTLSQYVAQYESARVVRSTMKVTFTNVEESFSKSVGITQLPAGETVPVTPSATVQWSEQPRTKSAYLGPLPSSRSVKTLMNSGTLATAFGNRHFTTSLQDTLISSNLALPPQASPQARFYWNIWVQNSLAGADEVDGTDLRIIQYYTINFFDRKQLTA